MRTLYFFLEALLVILMFPAGNFAYPAHSLDPLTPGEISLTSKTIRQAYPGVDYMFILVTLREPKKESLLPFFLSNSEPPEGSIPRESFTILLDPTRGITYEVVVQLNKGNAARIISWKQLPRGTESPLAAGEVDCVKDIVRADSKVKQRLGRYGLMFTNMSLVIPDVWKYGYKGDRPAYHDKRMAQVYFFVKFFDHDNFYAHPLGFLAIVDVLANKVVEIEELPIQTGFDTSDRRGEKVPSTLSNYDPAVSGRWYRKDVSPISIAQEKGPSFTIQRNLLLWQKWKMRLGRNSREGLFLHHVSYNDGGVFRPILYRGSFTEVYVPYGDPKPPYHRKMPFDIGWLGVGFAASEMRSPDVCRGSVYFMDFVHSNKKGDPYVLKNTICVYEEDAGILWWKKDPLTGRIVTARSQRLVLTFISCQGNYDYQFKWMFYQDASIKVEVTLSGILTQNMLATEGTPGGHGTLVFPGVTAQYHQHQFCVRLDTEIDGNRNTAAVVDVLPDSDILTRSNPYGNGFHAKTTLLKTASSARTNARAETARTWKILGEPGNVHPINGNRRAWKLIPEHRSARQFITRDSPLHAIGAFADFDFWVTRYEEDQLYAAGLYLNNSGLPEWVASNPTASVENTDIVIWHVFGITHIPRAEDAPVMPSETTSFWLKPSNFFLENPAIDVLPFVHESLGPQNIKIGKYT